MDKWQTAEWLGFAAIIVAVIFGLAALWAARSYGNRRGSLLVAHTTTRLLASGSRSDDLKVTFRDHDVTDPHLVSLLLKNVGPKDITREQFDGGNFRIQLQGSTFYGLLQIDSSDGELPTIRTDGAGADNACVEVQPTLMPKGVEWTVEAIVSGSAEPKIRGRLVETDIVEGETRSEAVLGALVASSSFSSVGIGTALARAAFHWLRAGRR